MGIEEQELLMRLAEHVASVRNDLESIRAFLKAADVQEDCDIEVKEWLKQVQDVAYDAEDVLDKFTQIAHHRTNGFSAKVQNVFKIRKDSRAGEQIASEIQSIQTRIGYVLGDLQKWSSRFATFVNPTSSNDSKREALLQEDIEVVGIETPRGQLLSLLLSADSDMKVHSVAGSAGLGKSLVVRNVYNDAIVKKHFDAQLWISVSRLGSVADILIGIIQQLVGEIADEEYKQLMDLTINDLTEGIRQTLQAKRYIIVIDEIWLENVWEAIRSAFPANFQASRVVIITRHHHVGQFASLQTGGTVLSLKPLPREESWTLFCKKAFPETSCPPHLMEIARDIVNQLDGVPLSILLIGGALGRKDFRIEEWEQFHKRLVVALDHIDKSEATEKLISLVYDDLPLYLKPCFLYLSIFPPHHRIEKSTLLRLWAAEGLLQVKEGETGDEVGESNLNELSNRSLVQVVENFVDGRLNTVSIHDLIQEFLLSKGREHNTATTVCKRFVTWPEKVRRLVIHYLIDDTQTGTNFENLRSLVIFGYKGCLAKSFLSEILYAGPKFMLLKVLDLRGAPLNKIPEGIFYMFHLRYLNMSHTEIKCVPGSIDKLQNLEFLNLRHTPVKKLPVEILKLHRLEQLLVNRRGPKHMLGCKVPKKIGTMLSLRKLIDIEVNDTEIVKGIGNLTQLTMLGITRLRSKDGMELCLSLRNLTSLRVLTINALEGNDTVDLQYPNSLNLPLLRTLAIGGRLEKLPPWIASLRSLATLHLHCSKLSENLLEVIEDMPNLCELLLDRAYEGKQLWFKAGLFKRLKVLKIQEVSGLQSVKIEMGSMALLEELQITHKRVLEFPSGIEYLTRLRDLHLRNSHMTSQDHRKIAHIHRVLID